MSLLQISKKKTGNPREKWTEGMNRQFHKKGIPNDQEIDAQKSLVLFKLHNDPMKSVLFYYLHFTGKEIETQGFYVICPRLYIKW